MNKKTLGILAFLLLAAGVFAAFLATQQSTENRQHASSFNDLNSAEDITSVNNPDGTMGPATWLGNFSNTLPDAYLGSLSFRVTDPVQRNPESGLPTQAQGRGNGATATPTNTPAPSVTGPTGTQGGPQTITSLVLVVRKVEVHLARLGIPGAKNSIPSVTPGRPSVTPGKPSGTPTPKDNQGVDKWETLNIGGTQTVDLVALAKSHDFTVLGLTKLANGLYTEVRLYIASATATLSNGTKVTLTIPGRGNIVRVVEPFVIDFGKTTTITMDFDAQNSVIQAGDKYLLKPVVARFDQSLQ